MKQTEIAYAAGLFDGEGCITITKGDRRGATHSGRVQFVNTNEIICQWMAENLGGTLSKRPTTRPHHKPLYTVVWTGGTAPQFLRLLLPYLQIKRRQAELLLAFYEDRGEYVKDGRIWRVTTQEWERRERLRQQVVALNH